MNIVNKTNIKGAVNMNDSYEILKALEANGKRLEACKKENEKVFERIDKCMKKFFMKVVKEKY
jgi:hypothetical protein